MPTPNISPSNALLADHPIKIATEDLFGLSSFAKALANSLVTVNPEEGLVISVEGPWGAGKSSAIALTLREVKIRELVRVTGRKTEDLEALSPEELDELWDHNAKLRSTHVVRFNPWYFSAQENLVRAFFSELASALGVQPEGMLSKTLGRIAEYLPAAGAIAGGVGAAYTTGNPAAAGAAGAAGRSAGEGLQRLFTLDTSLEKSKQKLDDALRKAGQRIIVVIDDIDRLLPGEMRAIFSLLKSLGDLPNVLYVAAFDDAVVKKALEGEKIDPDFLEKIVPVSLKLPPPWKAELRNLLFQRLDAVIGEEKPADRDRWALVCRMSIEPYLKTPRDVIRLANTLQVIWPNVVGDVDFTDLVAITALQLFEPLVYADVRDNIELLAGVEPTFSSIVNEEIAARFEPSEKANAPKAAKEALASLFPKLGKAWAKFGSAEVDLTMRAQRRICTAEYCRNYFLFGRDARRLSRMELELILKGDAPAPLLRQTIECLAEQEKPGGRKPIAVFLDQLAETVSEKPLLSTAFLKALLDVSDELLRREDIETNFFTTENSSRLKELVLAGIQTYGPNRVALLQVLGEHPTGLSLSAEIVAGLALRHGLYGGAGVHESQRLFSNDEIEGVVSLLRKRIYNAAWDGSIWSNPSPIGLIWQWKRWSTANEIRDWVNRNVSDDRFVLELCTALPSKVYVSGSDGFKIMMKFDRKLYDEFFPVDALFGRMRTLAEASGPNSGAAEVWQVLNEAEKTSLQWPH